MSIQSSKIARLKKTVLALFVLLSIGAGAMGCYYHDGHRRGDRDHRDGDRRIIIEGDRHRDGDRFDGRIGERREFGARR